MRFNDIYFIIINKLFVRDNVLFYLVNILTILAIFICITIINFSLDFKNSNYNYFDTRVLFISKSDDNKINDKVKNIKHVSLVESKKYAQPAFVTTNEFDVELLDSEISLRPLLLNNIKITKGSEIKNDYDIICPESFYPYSLYITNNIGVFEKKLIDKHFIKKSYLVGREVKVVNHNNEEVFLKIVGTYKNRKLDGINTCYISKKSFDMFKSDYEICSDDVCEEYNSFMVLVDDFKNMEYVENELSKLGFSSIRQVSFDEVLFSQLISIPTFVASIVIVLSITLVYSFIRRKSEKSRKEQAILKSLGYKEEDIIKIYKSELSICYFISSFVSFLLYLIIFYFIYNYYLYEFRFYNYLIPIPYFYFVIFIILFYFYNMFIIKIFIKNNYKFCVRKLFEE